MKSLKGILRAIVTVFALAVACGAAKADTIATYNVSGTMASGGTLTGTFTYDYNPMSGGINPITAVNLLVDGVDFTNCPGALGTCNVYNNLNGGTADGFTVANAGGYPYIFLEWSAVNLGAPPSVLNLITNTLCVNCGTNGVPLYGGYFDNLASGTATAVNTPENGSLVTLLTGLLALGIFAVWQSRRKLAIEQI